MVADEIKKFLHGDVLSDESSRSDYSHDYSIFKVNPEVVVFPRDVDDLKNLVKFVSQEKKSSKNISLTGRSAGTDMTGGPLTDSIVVVFTKYFNHIKEITTLPFDAVRQSSPQAAQGDAGYAVVEPGVYFWDFEKELLKKNLLYPPYPASKEICALGGMISNNSGGEKTLAYGKTEDYVEELKMVLSDGEEHIIRPFTKSELEAKIKEQSFEGELYRKLYELIRNNYERIMAAKPDVSKNSAGYALWNVWDGKTFDMTKLFVGSQGTLGLVAEAKLRLVTPKKYTRIAVVFLKDLGLIADLIGEILKFKPESLESYDDKTLIVALRFLPGIIKSMGGFGGLTAGGNFFKLIWQFLPEALMVLKGGLPKMVVLIELTSDDENELTVRLQSFKEALGKFDVQVRILKEQDEAKKYWTIRRQSFKLLHDHSTGKDTAPFIDDIIVKPEYLPKFLPKLSTILDKYKSDLIYTIAGHPGNGNFHIIPLVDLKKANTRQLITQISGEVYKLVFEYKGSITAEHNDGLIRSPYLEKMYGKEIMELFKEVKNMFDPLNIFNPGKKVGSSLAYSLDHLAESQKKPHHTMS